MNPLLEPLDDWFEGYRVNTDFRIGIQLSEALEDVDLSEEERVMVTINLLYGEEDYTGKLVLREYPRDIETIQQTCEWLLSGWNTDNLSGTKSKVPVFDYDVDGWRIYADFRRYYGVNLNTIDTLHFWEFSAMLWNLPQDSATKEVIEIRGKETNSKMSAEQRKAIKKAQKIYGLKRKERKELTNEQIDKIDDFDKLQAERKKRRELRDKGD